MNSMEDHDPGDGLPPTIRIEVLDAAKNPPVSVKPDAPLNVATTIMQLNDFSQLPVMQSEYEVEGVVSWKSIGARVLLEREREFVCQCMDPAKVIDIDTPLFDAVNVIQRHDYVLVQDKTNKIMGIVTASDIAQQFAQLSTPFLLVGEIERQLRRLILGKFTTEQLRASQNPGSAKLIEGPSDLTLGGYVHLLRKKENWDCLGLSGIDRKKFVERLNEVRKIRNEVMHFSLDDMPPETIKKIKKLESFADFFRNLARIGAI